MAMRGLRGLFADPSRLPDAWHEAAMDEFVRVFTIRANRLAIFSALRNVYLDEPFGESGFWDRLPTLNPPALFVWGDRDVLVPAGFARFVERGAAERAVRGARGLRSRPRVRGAPSEPRTSPESSSRPSPDPAPLSPVRSVDWRDIR